FFDNYYRVVHLYEALFRAPSVTVMLKAYGQDYELFKVLKTDEETVTFLYIDETKSCKVSTRVSHTTAMAWPAISLPYDAIATVTIYPSLTKGKGADYRYRPRK
ncbi:MAG: hypothetical protein KGO52_13315, partial [Nitrospirota bacterium]|nr:hypothetical protein [Nitrospirota bacterium]